MLRREHLEEVKQWSHQIHISHQDDPASHVYAVHFQALGILKIGVTTRSSIVFNTMESLVRKGYPESTVRDATKIWQAPGGKLTEAWIQIHVAIYTYPTVLTNKSTRMSEWFLSDPDTPDEIKCKLDQYYSQFPQAHTYPIDATHDYEDS